MVYDNVRELCLRNKISVSKLEKEVGLGNATVRNWKKSNPTVRTLRVVADYFDVSVDDLLKEDNQNDRS